MSLYDFDHACAWRCCTNKKYLRINRKYLWHRLIEMKRSDYAYISSPRLIYEKSVDLNNNKHIRSTLCIGLDPENKFQVAARIDMHSTGEYLSLDSKEFRGLLSYMDYDKYNILNEFPLKKNTASTAKRFHIKMSMVDDSEKKEPYTVVVSAVADSAVTTNDRRRSCIHIDYTTLQQLCILREHIQYIKHGLEQRSNKSEVAFLQLMQHFSNNRTIHQACIDCERAEKRASFFTEISLFHCDCLDKEFVMEIALHCEIWFGFCVPYFIGALMLHQFERRQTFASNNWPYENNKISTDELSKSGFYYTGTMDKTICAFCGLCLADWQPGDIPSVKHSKLQPACPYLIDHTSTLNV